MQFRVITVSYDDIDPEMLEDMYGTDDPIEASLKEQDALREDREGIHGLLAQPTTEIYVNVFDPGGMMFNDEFLREVIQILRVERWHIDIEHKNPHTARVRVEFEGVIPGPPERRFRSVAYGPALGAALREIREDLRQEAGK